jgi:prepilin peptidase CpaA
MTYSLATVFAIITGVIAATTDLKSGRIPNLLTLPAMFIGIGIQLLSHGIAGLIESSLGIFVCVAVPGIVYKASKGVGIGGGDIKLFAAIGALLGPTHGLEIELSSFLLVGIFALFRLTYAGHLTNTVRASLSLLTGFFIPNRKNKTPAAEPAFTEMRMGPAIALAVITVTALPVIMRWLPWL